MSGRGMGEQWETTCFPQENPYAGYDDSIQSNIRQVSVLITNNSTSEGDFGMRKHAIASEQNQSLATVYRRAFASCREGLTRAASNGHLPNTRGNLK